MKKLEEFFLLSTSMGGNKRSMWERFRNLAAPARPRRYVALLLLVVMATVASCTFGGGKTDDDQNAVELTPLSAEEVNWFNEEFFNSDVDGSAPKIHNQFTFSLYDSPEDIDLYETFYIGTGKEETVTEAELREIMADQDWDTEPDCPCQKNSVENMDAALQENMEITLDETNGVGLDSFVYLADYDAYYVYHGDTNYQTVTIESGERDGEGNVYLYYTALTNYESQRVLHLKEQDDTYLFLSNTELNANTPSEDEEQEDSTAEEDAELKDYLAGLDLDEETMSALPDLVVKNTDYGLSLRMPGFWEELGIVAVTSDDLLSGSKNGVFAAYDRYSWESFQEQDPDYNGGGWLFTIRAVPFDEVKDLDGNGLPEARYNWTGAAEQIIGTDDTYAYCYSEPTDVRFNEDDSLSQATYELLADDIQDILENFLLDNNITPNSHLPGMTWYDYRPQIWQLPLRSGIHLHHRPAAPGAGPANG